MSTAILDADTSVEPDPWDLVNRTQTGDMDAFSDLYSRYKNVVFRYLLFRTGDRELAEDLTSETFLRALTQIDSVTYRGQDIGAWFITIARNLLLDHLKSNRNNFEVNTSEILDSKDEDLTPEEITIQRDTILQVRGAVEKLSPRQRECVTLRFLDDLSVTETATVMRLRSGAVKAHQSRAMTRLHGMLNGGGPQRGTTRPCARPDCRTLITGTWLCSRECLRLMAGTLGDPTPSAYCSVPGCGKSLTQAQRRHHAVTCDDRCGSRLATLRTTRRTELLNPTSIRPLSTITIPDLDDSPKG